jgi:hypothetical protein
VLYGHGCSGDETRGVGHSWRSDGANSRVNATFYIKFEICKLPECIRYNDTDNQDILVSVEQEDTHMKNYEKIVIAMTSSLSIRCFFSFHYITIWPFTPAPKKSETRSISHPHQIAAARKITRVVKTESRLNLDWFRYAFNIRLGQVRWSFVNVRKAFGRFRQRSGLLGLPTWPYRGCRHSGSG